MKFATILLLVAAACFVSAATAEVYGRGTGHWTSDACEKSSTTLSFSIGLSGMLCEKWGLFYYPRCKMGYHNVGCCLCSNE